MPISHFDIIAPIYHRARTYLNLEMMLNCTDLPAMGSLLDVGGGTGRVGSALRDKVGQVVLADVSHRMLSFAASWPGLQLAAAASESLPFPDACFDRVIMVDAFHHVSDQPSTAREMLRVLKPGGRIVIEEPDIRTLGAKLIAFGEKLLLMRSHFLAPAQIASLFSSANTAIRTAHSTVWIIAGKQN